LRIPPARSMPSNGEYSSVRKWATGYAARGLK
jgi:hypothetical protein